MRSAGLVVRAVFEERPRGFRLQGFGEAFERGDLDAVHGLASDSSVDGWRGDFGFEGELAGVGYSALRHQRFQVVSDHGMNDSVKRGT